MSADLFAAFAQSSNDKPSTSLGKGGSSTAAQRDIFSLDSTFAEAKLDDSGVWNHSDEVDLLSPRNQQAQEIGRPSEATAVITDDEWGEFEDAATSKPQPDLPHVQPPISSTAQTVNEYEDKDIWNTSLSSNTAKEISTSWKFVQNLDTEPTESYAVAKSGSGKHVGEALGNEVLFDVDDEIDDFGDFERGPSNLAIQNPVPLQNEHEIKMQALTETDSHGEDLISISARSSMIDQAVNTKRQAQMPLSSPTKPEQKSTPKSPAKAMMSNGKPQRNKLQKKSAFQPLPSTINDDAWDDFEETVTSESAPPQTIEGQGESSDDMAWFSSLLLPCSSTLSVRPTDVPPTNIPPPVILLSLFPALFRKAHADFFQPLAGLNPTSKAKTMGDTKVIDYLQGCLALVRTAAHVIAGRKYRWKRDTFLSQGMRIGPAGRSGGGMKLTGIDKAENNKEEREVLDVVRAWGELSGRLRSAVAAGQNASSSGSVRVIPDVQETMVVQTAKQTEGGVPAPHQCALCGLKRDERVVKVDDQVQDSFGEWWIEQVSMHKDCRSFWEEQKDSIRQR